MLDLTHLVGCVRVLDLAVNIWSSDLSTQQSLDLPASQVELPEYQFCPIPADTAYSIRYEPDSRISFLVRDGNTTIEARGPRSVVGSSSVLPYLAYRLIEVQLQRTYRLTVASVAAGSDGKAALLMGPVGAGKTSVLLELCRRKNIRMISDSLSIVGSYENVPIVVGGSQWITLRKGAVQAHHPSLIDQFENSRYDDNPWNTFTRINPSDLRLSVHQASAKIVGLYRLRISDEGAALSQTRLRKKEAKLVLYEAVSRYIRGTSLPVLSGHEATFSGFIDSMDDIDLHHFRASLVDLLIDTCGFFDIRGSVASVSDMIVEVLES